VDWIAFEADPTSGKFEVEIHIENPDLLLRSGVVGRARVLKKEHSNVLAIPRDAILLTDAGPAVYVVEQDRAVSRPITLGPDQGLMVVAATGLHSGDRIVVRGQRELVEGALVKATEEASSPDGTNGKDPAAVKANRAHRGTWGRQEGDA
jgi:RND family efflux transporter MFP subunit